MTLLWVALGAAVGAPARHGTDRVLRRLRPGLPYGTLTVNVVGCFALGCLVGSDAGPAWQAALGTGACGAFTTYSTFAVDAFLLARGRRRLVALGYTIASVSLGLVALAAGLALTG